MNNTFIGSMLACNAFLFGYMFYDSRKYSKNLGKINKMLWDDKISTERRQEYLFIFETIHRPMTPTIDLETSKN